MSVAVPNNSAVTGRGIAATGGSLLASLEAMVDGSGKSVDFATLIAGVSGSSGKSGEGASSPEVAPQILPDKLKKGPEISIEPDVVVTDSPAPTMLAAEPEFVKPVTKDGAGEEGTDGRARPGKGPKKNAEGQNGLLVLGAVGPVPTIPIEVSDHTAEQRLGATSKAPRPVGSEAVGNSAGPVPHISSSLSIPLIRPAVAGGENMDSPPPFPDRPRPDGVVTSGPVPAGTGEAMELLSIVERPKLEALAPTVGEGTGDGIEAVGLVWKGMVSPTSDSRNAVAETNVPKNVTTPLEKSHLADPTAVDLAISEEMAAEMADVAGTPLSPPVESGRPAAVQGVAPQQLLPSMDGAPYTSAVNLSGTLAGQAIDMAAGGQWIDDIARQIASIANNPGHGSFRVTSNGLGMVQVDMTPGERGADIVMTVDNEAAHDALSGDRERLIHDARLAAVRVGEVRVERAPTLTDAQRSDVGSSHQQSSSGNGQVPFQAFAHGGGQGGRPDTPTAHQQHDENGAKASVARTVLNDNMASTEEDQGRRRRADTARYA